MGLRVFPIYLLMLLASSVQVATLGREGHTQHSSAGSQDCVPSSDISHRPRPPFAQLRSLFSLLKESFALNDEVQVATDVALIIL